MNFYNKKKTSEAAGAGYFPRTPPTPRLVSLEADVRLDPVQSPLALDAGCRELLGHRIAVPPQVPVRLQRVDEPKAGSAEELTLHKAEVALREQRHVADPHQSLLTALIEVVGGRAQLH